MRIPYKDIIDNCVLKGELVSKKKESFFAKIARKITIKSIVAMLEQIIHKDTEIYKRDFIDFYIFLVQVQDALGEKLEECVSDAMVDNINYALSFYGTRDTIFNETVPFQVTVRTVDTVSDKHAYFEVIYEEQNKPIQKFETTCLSTTGYIGYPIYRIMIQTIIKYIKYCN